MDSSDSSVFSEKNMGFSNTAPATGILKAATGQIVTEVPY
jgi:hypothetical protein